MTRLALTYILLLLILCVGSFWYGTRQAEVVEKVATQVELRPVYIDKPAPPAAIEPAEPKVVYLTKYKTEWKTQ